METGGGVFYMSPLFGANRPFPPIEFGVTGYDSCDMDTSFPLVVSTNPNTG